MEVAKKRVRLSDQIRDAVIRCGMSRYEIWKATGIDQATLSRFVACKAGMSLDNLDRLADLLDLRVVSRSRRRPKGV